MDEITKIEQKLDREVERRDQKIGEVYKKMDIHYQTLDKKMDRHYGDINTQIQSLSLLIQQSITKRSNVPIQNTGSGVWQITVFVLCLGMLGSGISFTALTLRDFMSDSQDRRDIIEEKFEKDLEGSEKDLIDRISEVKKDFSNDVDLLNKNLNLTKIEILEIINQSNDRTDKRISNFEKSIGKTSE